MVKQTNLTTSSSLGTAGTSAPGLIHDLQSKSHIEILLDVNGGRTFFNSQLETYISIAKEYFRNELNGNQRCQAYRGNVYTVPVDKAFDFVTAVFANVRLPGMIGVKGDAAAGGNASTLETHAYPFMVNDPAGCEKAGDYAKCVPNREMLSSEFAWDYISSPDGAGAGDDRLQAGCSLTRYPYAHWVNGAPMRLLEQFSVKSGKTSAQSISYLAAYALEEIEGALGRRQSYQAGFYNTREELIQASLTSQEYFVKIPTWFEIFNPLRVVKMQLADLSYEVQLASMNSLIVCSDANTVPYLSKIADNQVDWYRTVTSDASAQGTATHPYASTGVKIDEQTLFDIDIVQEVFYIDDDHRAAEMLKAETHESNMLLHHIEVQQHLFTDFSSDIISLTIRASNPLIESWCGARLQANLAMNDWFNFTRVGPEEGGVGKFYTNATVVNNAVTVTKNHQVKTNEAFLDPFLNIQVNAGDQVRWQCAPAAQLRTLPFARCHTNLPRLDKMAYLYGFIHAIYPEEKVTGSGTIGCGRIDGYTYLFQLHPWVMTALALGFAGLQVFVVMKFWNIFTTFAHTGGLRFQAFVKSENATVNNVASKYL